MAVSLSAGMKVESDCSSSCSSNETWGSAGADEGHRGGEERRAIGLKAPLLMKAPLSTNNLECCGPQMGCNILGKECFAEKQLRCSDIVCCLRNALALEVTLPPASFRKPVSSSVSLPPSPSKKQTSSKKTALRLCGVVGIW